MGLKYEFEKIPNQNFDIGRVIRFDMCNSCEKHNKNTNITNQCFDCTNYAPQMRKKKYTIEDFITEYNPMFKQWNREMVDDLCEFILIFPKGRYYTYNSDMNSIEIYKNGRQDVVRVFSVYLDYVNVGHHNIADETKIDTAFSQRIKNVITEINEKLKNN